MGNVFAHTPDGTGFAVTPGPGAGGGAVLTVAVGGSGMSADQVRRGASRGGSTGLGLDIARRVAQSSGGRLDLTTGPTSGARVTLELGPPAAGPSPEGRLWRRSPRVRGIRTCSRRPGVRQSRSRRYRCGAKGRPGRCCSVDHQRMLKVLADRARLHQGPLTCQGKSRTRRRFRVRWAKRPSTIHRVGNTTPP
ncbi:sensor histidine kinase [Streptomyces mirabilis]|uniref:sensor histidine kinase n=1 Tax=Streptomyces mirabilis TaxID=68239 RepID=UPI003647215B